MRHDVYSFDANPAVDQRLYRVSASRAQQLLNEGATRIPEGLQLQPPSDHQQQLILRNNGSFNDAWFRTELTMQMRSQAGMSVDYILK